METVSRPNAATGNQLGEFLSNGGDSVTQRHSRRPKVLVTVLFGLLVCVGLAVLVAHRGHSAQQCIKGKKGPSCSKPSDCNNFVGCLRCAKSGNCTAEPLPTGKCIKGEKGPSCFTDIDCKGLTGCLRCANSGYCTDKPIIVSQETQEREYTLSKTPGLHTGVVVLIVILSFCGLGCCAGMGALLHKFCTTRDGEGALNEVVAIIMTVLLPPLGVYWRFGLGTEFVIALILSLCCYVPGLIYGLCIILFQKTDGERAAA